LLSLRSGRDASGDYLVVRRWRTLASLLPTIADVVIGAIFPWCLTPEMYGVRPEFVDALVAFVRGRPAPGQGRGSSTRPMRSARTTRAHCSATSRPRRSSPSARDLVYSTRFAEPLANGIAAVR
jgi:hypothetical protein